MPDTWDENELHNLIIRSQFRTCASRSISRFGESLAVADASAKYSATRPATQFVLSEVNTEMQLAWALRQGASTALVHIWTLMNNATNLDLEKTAKGTYSLAGDALLHLFLRLEDIKLTSIYPRGTVLFTEGQPADRVYLLRSGRAKISISSAAGKKVILRVQPASAILGVNSVIKDEPYDVTVETIERCRIDFVSRSDFMKILDESETARAGVADTLSNELSDVVEHVRSLLLSQSASEKLARLLLKWCDEQGEVGPHAVRMNLGLTHEEMAQIICVSRETVTRLFAELRRKQIVSFADNAIFVRDLNALKSLACHRKISGVSSS